MTDTNEDVTYEHVWVRVMMMPVEVKADPEDGVPVIEVRASNIKRLVDTEDIRVGCLVCDASLDDGWGKLCTGPSDDSLLKSLLGE